MRLQRLQQTVHGGAGEIEPVGDFADPESSGTARQDLEYSRRAVD
jgi:hypothetical protein